MSGNIKHYDVIIIGGGQGAGILAGVLRQQKLESSVLIIGDEPDLPYERPPLSKAYFTGDVARERLYIRKADYYSERDFDLALGCTATALDCAARTISLSDGRQVSYEHCVLATGGRPRPLPVPGNDLAGVHFLRSLADVTAIRADLTPGARLVVIGGGYIGLEVAASARKLGHDVTIVEAMERVLARVTSPTVSQFFADYHRQHGARVMLSTGVSSLQGNAQGRVAAVDLADGSALPADVVVVGIGILPNVELAMAAGLACDNGIIVDHQCRTSDSHVFALGDVAAHPNPFADGRTIRLESVQNAADQAKVVASVLKGENPTYADLPWFWSDQYDAKLQTAGLSAGYDDTVVRGEASAPGFSVVYLRDGRMIAIDAINAIKDFMGAKKLILAGARPDLSMLADPHTSMRDIAAALDIA